MKRKDFYWNLNMCQYSAYWLHILLHVMLIYFSFINVWILFQGDELAAFGIVIDQMLQDVQERLVYRAQVFVIKSAIMLMRIKYCLLFSPIFFPSFPFPSFPPFLFPSFSFTSISFPPILLTSIPFWFPSYSLPFPHIIFTSLPFPFLSFPLFSFLSFPFPIPSLPSLFFPSLSISPNIRTATCVTYI